MESKIKCSGGFAKFKQKFFIVSLFLQLPITSPIFAWGSATFPYYANELSENPGYLNLQEIYSAMLPDMFNTMFGSLYFDSLGQVVTVLVNGYQTKGSYRVKWDAHHQSSGIYLYQLKAGGFNAARQIFLHK